jgi:hypothetical protein
MLVLLFENRVSPYRERGRSYFRDIVDALCVLPSRANRPVPQLGDQGFRLSRRHSGKTRGSHRQKEEQNRQIKAEKIAAASTGVSVDSTVDQV